MNQNVKEFIEQNIDLIEQKDWTNLFDKWYTKYYMFDKTVDNTQIIELFDILQEIGITLYEHELARRELIKRYFNEYIEDKIFTNEKTITGTSAILSLHSWLGVEMMVLKILFTDLCDQRGFTELPHSKEGMFKLP